MDEKQIFEDRIGEKALMTCGKSSKIFAEYGKEYTW